VPRPVVAIVGRPNVGKSTFFNRIVGQRIAIVEDEPGTTRDRLYADAEWDGVTFTLIDTGGLETEVIPELEDSGKIIQRTREQARLAIEEADVVLFMVDTRTGPSPEDFEVAEILRRSGKPILLAANKADNPARRQNAVEFYQLGLGDPIAISSLHGLNTGDLLDAIVEALPEETGEEEQPDLVKIAIVGRPNVGKSSLLNTLFGQQRAIVSDIPGTTRDSLDTLVNWEGCSFLLIDTAGIRRRGKIEVGVERYGVMRAMRSIDRADVVLLVIDASEGTTAQDTHVAGYILEQSKGIVVVSNKWDLVPKDEETRKEFAQRIQDELHFMPYVPVLFISAKTGQGVNRVLETTLRVVEQRNKRIPTAALNKLVKEAVARHAPPARPGHWLKFYYVTQAETNPPTFVFFVNDPELIHFSYQRYLENQLRQVFGFEGTPLKMVFRRREV
jgi:GTPase